MALAFKLFLAKTDCTLRAACEDEGVAVRDGDMRFYALSKKDSVSAKHEVALLESNAKEELTVIVGDAARKILSLAPGAKQFSLDPAAVPRGYTCFVQSTSPNRKVAQSSQVLVVFAKASGGSASPGGLECKLAADGTLPTSVGSKRKPEAATPAPALRGAKKGRSSAWSAAKIEELKGLFAKYGEVGEATPTAKVPADAPEELREMLLVASEWHVQKDSYGVFGLNFFDKGGYIDKATIMGDASLVEEWKEGHPSPNCGEEGWECIGAFSEFDYIFVEVQTGATRRIVNNCDDDEPLTADFSDFLTKVERFAVEYVGFRDTAGDDWYGSDDTPQFRR